MRTTDIETELAQTAAEVEKRLTDRDMAIFEAFALGMSLRRIAEATGLSHVGVKKLVERRQYDFVIRDEDGTVISVGEAKRLATATTPEHSDRLRGRWTVVWSKTYDAEGAADD